MLNKEVPLFINPECTKDGEKYAVMDIYIRMEHPDEFSVVNAFIYEGWLLFGIFTFYERVKSRWPRFLQKKQWFYEIRLYATIPMLEAIKDNMLSKENYEKVQLYSDLIEEITS